MTNIELMLPALAWAIVQICRALPAIIWSLRCRSTSKVYRCPPLLRPIVPTGQREGCDGQNGVDRAGPNRIKPIHRTIARR